MQLYKIEMLLHSIIWLISVGNFLLWLCFFRVLYACFLRSGPHSVGRITHDTVEDGSYGHAMFIFAPVKLMCTDVHSQEVRHRQLIVLEVRIDIKLVNFIKSFDARVLSLCANAVALEDPHVQITSNHKRVKKLASHCYATRSNKWVIDHVAWLDFCLVCHQKGELMIGRSRTKVRTFLEVEFVVVSIVVLSFSAVCILLITRDNSSTIYSSVSGILNNLIDELWLLKANIFIIERKLFEKLYYLDLLLEANPSADCFDAELEFLALGEQWEQFCLVYVVN